MVRGISPQPSGAGLIRGTWPYSGVGEHVAGEIVGPRLIQQIVALKAAGGSGIMHENFPTRFRLVGHMAGFQSKEVAEFRLSLN